MTGKLYLGGGGLLVAGFEGLGDLVGLRVTTVNAPSELSLWKGTSNVRPRKQAAGEGSGCGGGGETGVGGLDGGEDLRGWTGLKEEVEGVGDKGGGGVLEPLLEVITLRVRDGREE